MQARGPFVGVVMGVKLKLGATAAVDLAAVAGARLGGVGTSAPGGGVDVGVGGHALLRDGKTKGSCKTMLARAGCLREY